MLDDAILRLGINFSLGIQYQSGSCLSRESGGLRRLYRGYAEFHSRLEMIEVADDACTEYRLPEKYGAIAFRETQSRLNHAE